MELTVRELSYLTGKVREDMKEINVQDDNFRFLLTLKNKLDAEKIEITKTIGKNNKEVEQK